MSLGRHGGKELETVTCEPNFVEQVSSPHPKWIEWVERVMKEKEVAGAILRA